MGEYFFCELSKVVVIGQEAKLQKEIVVNKIGVSIHHPTVRPIEDRTHLTKHAHQLFMPVTQLRHGIVFEQGPVLLRVAGSFEPILLHVRQQRMILEKRTEFLVRPVRSDASIHFPLDHPHHLKRAGFPAKLCKGPQ